MAGKIILFFIVAICLQYSTARSLQSAKLTTTQPMKTGLVDVDIVVSIHPEDLDFILQSSVDLKYESDTTRETFLTQFHRLLVAFDIRGSNLQFMKNVITRAAEYNKRNAQQPGFKALQLWISVVPDNSLFPNLLNIMTIIQQVNSIYPGTISSLFPNYSNFKTTSKSIPFLIHQKNMRALTATPLDPWTCTQDTLDLAAISRFPTNKTLFSRKSRDAKNSIHTLFCSALPAKIRGSGSSLRRIYVTLNLVSEGSYAFNREELASAMSQVRHWSSSNNINRATMIIEARSATR